MCIFDVYAPWYVDGRRRKRIFRGALCDSAASLLLNHHLLNAHLVWERGYWPLIRVFFFQSKHTQNKPTNNILFLSIVLVLMDDALPYSPNVLPLPRGSAPWSLWPVVFTCTFDPFRKKDNRNFHELALGTSRDKSPTWNHPNINNVSFGRKATTNCTLKVMLCGNWARRWVC